MAESVTFKNANATRWDSLRVMVKTYLLNEDSIRKVLLMSKIKDVGELLLTEEDSASMVEFLAFLEIFAAATKALQSNSVPTMNLVPLTYLVIKGDLEDGANSDTITNKAPYMIALENIKHRLQPTMFQMCAALLDPTSCNIDLLWEDISERFNKMSRIDLLEHYLQKYKMIELDEEPAAGSQPQPQQEGTQDPAPEQTSFKSSLFKKLGVTRVATPTGFFTARDEILRYFERSLSCAQDTVVLDWWKENEADFPRLSKLTKFVLGCPSTSAAAESAFSSAGCIVTAKRSRISPFKVSDILFVKDNYHLLKTIFPAP